MQVADHAQQLGAIGASARSLLTVDAGDVEAGGPGALHDGGLPGQVLLVGADAQVDARDLEGDAGGLVLGRRPHDAVGTFDQAIAADAQRWRLGERLARCA